MLWVPSLYAAMGAPMITVSVVAAIMYKNLGVSNADIAFQTGFMYLAWTIKPLWSPLVEMWWTKRQVVLATECAMVVLLAGVALALALPVSAAIPVTGALFWLTALASATHDIAGDGTYIGAMSARDKAAYVGVQGVAWNVGRVVASGLLVSFTGYLYDEAGLDWSGAWMVVMVILALLMAAACVWHRDVLPDSEAATDGPQNIAEAARAFGRTFASFFAKRDIWLMVAVVFTYRLGEGLIERIGPLFLLDARAVGGLGLSNIDLGHINGTLGTVGFIGGALLGGLLCARRGLARVFVLLSLALNVPHVTYFYLSQARPHSLALIAAVVTIEKFGYGFGSVGHMLYMMQQVAPGPHRTAHYAFATGIMGLCMMSTGMVSGHLQRALGYQTFFVVALVASVPPILLALRAPFHADHR